MKFTKWVTLSVNIAKSLSPANQFSEFTETSMNQRNLNVQHAPSASNQERIFISISLSIKKLDLSCVLIQSAQNDFHRSQILIDIWKFILERETSLVMCARRPLLPKLIYSSMQRFIETGVDNYDNAVWRDVTRSFFTFQV